MKYFLFSLLLAVALTANTSDSYGQQNADGSVGAITIVKNVELTTVSPSQLGKGYHYIMRIPIANTPIPGATGYIPANSGKIVIGLGSKILLDYPDVNNPPINFPEYFTWTAQFNGGIWEITGIVNANIPSGFSGIIEIKIKPNVLNSSTVQVNFVNSNQGPELWSEADGSNNNVFQPYTVIIILPVKFTALDLTRSGCNVKVNFNTEEELNVKRYEVEASKDGVHFIKVNETAAKNLHLYKTDFALTDELRGEKVFVRIKSVDIDGQFQYSDTKVVSGICGRSLKMNIYPNPVTDNNKIVINATEGLFNGKYKISIRDFAGKLVQSGEADLKNVTRFDYGLTNLAAGKYIVQVINNDGSESAVLQLQKL